MLHPPEPLQAFLADLLGVGPRVVDLRLPGSCLALACEPAARRVIPEVFEELGRLTGRHYPVLDRYRMDDAEAAVWQWVGGTEAFLPFRKTFSAV